MEGDPYDRMNPFGMPAMVSLLIEHGPGVWQAHYEARIRGHEERVRQTRLKILGAPKAAPPPPPPTAEEKRAKKIAQLQAQAAKLGMKLTPEVKIDEADSGASGGKAEEHTE